MAQAKKKANKAKPVVETKFKINQPKEKIEKPECFKKYFYKPPKCRACKFCHECKKVSPKEGDKK